eukprot:CAMPEP_0177600084 /NCGR_PEP_ID=MMETSP0419_2-20121207/13400_1 /TAXON_ID=582737 /ORGANISM="Tetraselmis sp., Strain GSL018" /LENGTH=300 /DNA_ID=CAMNT_0019092985 /DNA_START=89 /DNA_END=988 /DNA_ORIENTATION=+
MGERKVLNKYYPPDFDPAKIPRGRKPKDQQMKVRMMLPMSIRCNTCGVFMYKGTKFNSRKEDALGETYLGIQIFRFYFRCSKCSAEITMKTDPKNSDYALEHGATRNYEPWREKDQQIADAVAAREAEEMGNAMKALENRTVDSRREMDIMSALDEMKALNARHATVDTEAALAALKRSAQEEEMQLLDEDESAVRALLEQRANYVKRIEEEEEGAAAAMTPAEPSGEEQRRAEGGSKAPGETKPGNFGVSARGVKVVVQPKRKAEAAPGGAGEKRPKQAEEPAGSGQKAGEGPGHGSLL